MFKDLLASVSQPTKGIFGALAGFIGDPNDRFYRCHRCRVDRSGDCTARQRWQAQDAQAAVEAAVVRFDRIDILVNNAGNFLAGFFEELSPEQVRNQIKTLLFGSMNVTRAALPVMRKQHSGLLIAISSTAGIVGQLSCTAYAAAKFGLEG